MAVSGLGVAMAASGLVLLTSGVKNATVKDTLTSLLKGKVPQANPTGSPAVGIEQGAQPSPGQAPAVPGSEGVISGNPGGTSQKANQALGKMIAATYGWATGPEWTALNDIVMEESGWNNQAQNPTSTAYGIGQFLDTTWATVGYSKTSDPALQIAAMLKYIRQRYGDPVKAQQFHLANNYY